MHILQLFEHYFQLQYLLMHYHIAQKITTNINEPLDKYTILEIVGFTFSIFGSMIYNRVVRFPCLYTKKIYDF